MHSIDAVRSGIITSHVDAWPILDHQGLHGLHVSSCVHARISFLTKREICTSCMPTSKTARDMYYETKKQTKAKRLWGLCRTVEHTHAWSVEFLLHSKPREAITHSSTSVFADQGWGQLCRSTYFFLQINNRRYSRTVIFLLYTQHGLSPCIISQFNFVCWEKMALQWARR